MNDSSVMSFRPGRMGIFVLTFLTFLVLLTFDSARCAAQLVDPRDLSGNVLWLDASDIDGDFQTGGTFVNGTTWVDKSPLQNANAVQASASSRPEVMESAFNGLTSLNFDGDDFLDIDSAAFGMLRNVESATMIGVLTTDLASSNRGMRALMVSSGANSAASRAGINLFDSFGTSIGGEGDFGLAGRRQDSDGFQRIAGGSITQGELSTMTGVFNFQNAELGLYVDGQLETLATNFQTAGSTSDTDSLNIRVGADAVLGNPRGFFTGQIAELIVYDRALDESEIDQINTYVAEKWFDTPGPGCDFDLDSDCDAMDVDALTAEIVQVKAGAAANLGFDLNGDGAVDNVDLDEWLGDAGAINSSVTGGRPFIPADANLDGVVDTSDFNIWNDAKFTTNDAYSNGDFNADGVVDTSDFNIWNDGKFTASDVSAVPEPSGFSLGLLGLLVLFLRRACGGRQHFIAVRL